ncbi:LADA_0G08372g1_1 [Lachancea dasiensis]|uniref:Mediator of RNA polymerase II transcription subunit 13 n=1 Tax=Lachancea dasiensis TaxID=1072105 RepID=A0A1G4JU13_9SACH|nr:LADA_0G08372g1_1 [Lachancea dasiensis]
MEQKDLPYRLEELLTNFYRLERVERINYVQYIPSKPEGQWSIQAELALRKRNSKVLVSLFSRELWCFSINSDPIPTLELDHLGNTPAPEKTGYFTPDISKPNLPTAYAVFLKALRRMMHISLCLESGQHLIPFGNSCLFRGESRSTKVVHCEPQLFENGDLCVSFSCKNMRLCNFDTKMIDESFLQKNAIYLAPSGIRAYLYSHELEKCVSPPPKNASVLLITLLVSHGIDLTKKKDLTWVRVIPNLDHLNGYTPSVSSYLDPPRATKTAIWPLELCFSQSSAPLSKSLRELSLQPDLQETFDLIDDFIQLKLTSAFKTPGSTTGALGSGTVTGMNALSTGGIYGDHYTAQPKNFQAGSLYNLNVFGNHNSRRSPGGPSANVTPVHNRSAPQSAENVTPGFLTTPNVNENVDGTGEEILISGTSYKRGENIWTEQNRVSENESESLSTNHAAASESSVDQDNAELDAELFGDDKDDEQLSSDEVNFPQQTKEITDDMFDMIDDSDTSREKTMQLKEPSPFSTDESPFKRKYLDIPLDEMTLPTTPLYMDPGAPLPIETPKERKKSVFAPLNFNPIIESNVDNKYKNGGKFSLDAGKNEDSLKFDISSAKMSSSEEEDLASSDEDLDDFAVNSNVGPALESNTQPTTFAIENQPPISSNDIQRIAFQDPSPLQSFENESGDEKGLREVHSEFWRYPKGASYDFSPSKAYSSHSNSVKPVQFNAESNGPDELSIIKNFTPLLDTVSKSPLANQILDDPAAKQAENKGKLKLDVIGATDSVSAPETSNSLPFLLRHMPLFSIPDIFFHNNPSLSATEGLSSVVNLLVEQIIFDRGLLGDLGSESVTYSAFMDCGDGIIKKCMQDSFSEFERLNGGQLIEEINYIPQPAVYVKKSDEIIKVKGDSDYFSSQLRLKPYKGIKNFRCLFLTTELKDDCLDFLSTMSQIYQSQELGFCELVRLTFADTPGLIYLINLEKDTLLLLSAQIVSYCSTNTQNILSVPLVLFLPISKKSLADVVLMTAKFEFLREEIVSKLPNVRLVLKLIPIDFLTDPMTSVKDYYDFSVGVYNSISPHNIKYTAIADELPKKVEFRTNKELNGQTTHFDVYFHLAYARSIDRNWVSAAWSSSSGNESGAKTWYIGNSTTAFEDVCNQMWQITSACLTNNYGRACLILTRFDSVLPDDELMHWRRLSSTSRNMHLAVVCVGDNTKLSLFDEDRMYPSFKPIFEDDRLSQNVDVTNLDNYEIVDIGREIHGIIFQRPLQLSNSQHRCAINTGALIRFKGSSSRNVVDKFEVSLLNCPHTDSTKLLRIILQEFRNLSTLNSWFGVSKSRSSFVPWHVLAVKKMINAIVHLKVTDDT